jgi:hypothetical protein
MLPRTSPTKAIRLRRRVTIVAASRQSPLEGERPTTGSDEGNSSKGIAYPEQPITRAHENWGSLSKVFGQLGWNRVSGGTGHVPWDGTGGVIETSGVARTTCCPGREAVGGVSKRPASLRRGPIANGR